MSAARIISIALATVLLLVGSDLVAAAPKKVDAPEMVRIPGKNYELGKFEVTQAEWQSLMENNPSMNTECGSNCPVEHVSWDDAQAYIAKLNTQTGKQYRLPTEAEWEYACLGGIKSEYCGGNDVDAVAWNIFNSTAQLHPVGQKQANAYGLHDMSGNVWEWVEDCDGEDERCTERVLRGGAWSDKPEVTRALSRDKNYAANQDNEFGFRLARTLSK